MDENGTEEDGWILLCCDVIMTGLCLLQSIDERAYHRIIKSEIHVDEMIVDETKKIEGVLQHEEVK